MQRSVARAVRNVSTATASQRPLMHTEGATECKDTIKMIAIFVVYSKDRIGMKNLRVGSYRGTLSQLQKICTLQKLFFGCSTLDRALSSSLCLTNMLALVCMACALSPYVRHPPMLAKNSQSLTPAVFVTPFFPNFEAAQTASRVVIQGWGGVMHAGFFTIDQAQRSNTYFTFSASLDGNPNAPILVWLQGKGVHFPLFSSSSSASNS